MPGASVFISYRRDDTAGEAGRLAEHLARRFGTHRVFIDIDTIAPGTDFTAALDRALTGTAVVLVVIGRQWLTAVDARGRRRLDDEDDFVRREVGTALERGARVVPVLVQNVSMPAAADLPAALTPLAARQAMAIQHEEFSADAQRLADAIAPFVEADTSGGSWPSRHRVTVAVLGVTLVLGVAGWQWQRSAATEDATARAAGQAAAEADAQRLARQRDVDNLVQVATDQRDRGQLADALVTLERTTSTDADLSRAKTLQEDVAMQWVRDLTVPIGQHFGDAMKAPVAVLDHTAPFATGPRQADLLAHLGWATFLRWRDGERGLNPADAYRKALAVDAANPYANAMLAHWTLAYEDRPDALDEARRLFRTAVDAGRATDVVRGLQISALKNDRGVQSRLETIRVMDEMRRRAEPLRPDAAANAWSIYYFALREGADLNTSALVAALPPSEHLLTLQWMFGDYVEAAPARLLQLRYYSALLLAGTGDRAGARDELERLSAELRSTPGMLRDAVQGALKALPAERRR